jgi:ankyrin repeat protein
MLIKNGATINAQNVEGESPLFMASNKKCIDTLLDLGADIKLRNKFGHTALLSCINNSNWNICKNTMQCCVSDNLSQINTRTCIDDFL